MNDQLPAQPPQWVIMGPEFGSNLPHGACTAYENGIVCGFPRRADGTCLDGHAAPPGWGQEGQEGEKDQGDDSNR